MPYKWVEPKLILRYRGVCIYPVYNNDSIEDPVSFHFSTNMHYTDFDEYNDKFNFDIRDVIKKIGISTNNTSVLETLMVGDPLKKILRKAIRDGIIKKVEE